MPSYIHAGTVLTANARGEVLRDAVIGVEGNRITSITPAAQLDPAIDRNAVIDARECTAIPGFVQTHVHLCQTLFRGRAEDMELLEWLQQRIFPFEAAHNERSMYASAQLGIGELIRSGTTTILDMGSVHHEEEVIRALGESGMRASVGKAMMDVNDVYPRLRESTEASIRSTLQLAEKWHNSYNGRLRYAVAPRFVLSCTDELLREAFAMLAAFPGMLYHTHASENRHEVDAVRQRCKMENIEFLNHLKILSRRTVLAHCIHLNANEIDLLSMSGTSVSHCPSSNLKLGSGIADVPKLLSRGITVSLGADGAPCNNTLDVFHEMRLAAALQKPFHGPTAMPAEKVFEMATIGGAKALGMETEIGSLEAGKKADIVLLNLNKPWNPLGVSGENPFASIVYSGSPENVDSVMVDGEWLYRSGAFTRLDQETTLANCRVQLGELLERVE